VREFMAPDPTQGAEKELAPLRARSGFVKGVRPWHPVDPVVKSMLGKTDRKLKETGTRQQLTPDWQLWRWVFRIGGPLRLEHGAGDSRGTVAESPEARDSIPGDANLPRFRGCRKLAFECTSVEGQLPRHDWQRRGFYAGVLTSLPMKQMDPLDEGLKQRNAGSSSQSLPLADKLAVARWQHSAKAVAQE